MTSSSGSTPADVAAVLAELEVRAAPHGILLLLVGAAARDLLLSTPSPRATNDVDVAVAVATADEVTALTAGLYREPLRTNRYVIGGVLVDIVPFGGVEADDRTVTSRDGFRMNVLGYREALASALVVELPGGVRARLPSLPAQAVLKLLAWNDRYRVTARDAIDLRSILVEYGEGARVADLYDDANIARLERHDYDPAVASADLLGAQAATVMADSVALLVDLVEQQLGDEGVLPVHMGGDAERNRALLRAFLTGMRER